jgi:hypothetical protein
MSESDQPSNPDIQRTIATMPALAKFVYLRPDEEISIERIEVIEGNSEAKFLSRGAKVIKSRKTDGGDNVALDQITVSRDQIIIAKDWYASLPNGFNDNAIATLLDIGRRLIDIANVIKPELPPKPVV